MLRDKKHIFDLIKADLIRVYNTPKVVAVGSRVTDRVSGKNDFDVLAQIPDLATLKKSPHLTPERVLFCERIVAYHPHFQGDNGFFKAYLHYTMASLRKSWAKLEDEYGNPVVVDVGWTDGEFPEHAVIL